MKSTTKSINEFWQWIQAIQEYYPHDKTVIAIAFGDIVISLTTGEEIAWWNNDDSIGELELPEDINNAALES